MSAGSLHQGWPKIYFRKRLEILLKVGQFHFFTPHICNDILLPLEFDVSI